MKLYKCDRCKKIVENSARVSSIGITGLIKDSFTIELCRKCYNSLLISIRRFSK